MAGLTIKTIFSAVDKLTGPARTMTGSVEKFGASAKRSISGISSGVSRMRGLLMSAAAILTTGVIAKSITDFAERSHDVGNMANVLGMSATALQELQYAAKMTDVDSEQLTNSFKKMNNSLGQLKAGSGSLYTYLVKTNPHLARQLRTTTDSSDAFMLLMDAISKETDTAKRASLTQAAFGKSGQEIIKMALEGSDGIARLRKEAYEYGSMISEKGVKASEHFSESLKRMNGSLNYLKNTALGDLVAALTPVVDNILAWTKANREMIEQKIHEAVGKIVDGATKLYNFLSKVYAVWEKLDRLANGHLARDILLVVVAWKAVKTAIALATAAAATFNLISAGGKGKAITGVAGAAGEGLATVGAGAAKWAGRFAGPAALGAGAMFGPPALAAVAVGSAMVPMMTNPTGFLEASRSGEHMEGGNFLTNLFTKLYGLGAGMRGEKKESEPAHVIIDFGNLPEGSSIRARDSRGVILGIGAPAATLRRGPAFLGPRP
jgi:molecular chaperone GrpE (heat shock protein)